MFDSLASLAVVSLVTVGSFASSFIIPKTHAEHLISPLPLTTPTATRTPTPLPTATPTPLPTATPTPLPTATPTPTPQPIVTSASLDTLFSKYSQQDNVDEELLKRIANCESGFNNTAVFLDYKGMFQFSSVSWNLTRQAMGEDPNPDLRTNAEESIKTAAYKIAHDGEKAWPNCAH